MFTLEIDTGNAAFADAPATEIARILREVARTLEDGGYTAKLLHDVNGNCVGSWRVVE